MIYAFNIVAIVLNNEISCPGRCGDENGCIGRKGTTSRGETAGQTGPMCVCSAVENNVHWEALMRFKNNGDYLYYSLGITRGDVHSCTALCRLQATGPGAIPRFWSSVLPRPAAQCAIRKRESSTGGMVAQNYSWQNNAAEENSLYRYYNPHHFSRTGNLRVRFLSSSGDSHSPGTARDINRRAEKKHRLI